MLTAGGGEADARVHRLERQQLIRLERFSIVEATTLVLLVGIAVPLEHGLGWPLGVRILGPIHGLCFLAYSWLAVQTVAGGGWRPRDAVRLFVVAFIPLAGYFNLAWLRCRAATCTGEQPA